MRPSPAVPLEARLRALARLADLRADRRLATKVDMSARGVTRRLRRLSALRSCCLRWGRWGGTARRA